MKNKELLLEISYKCNLNCIHCSSINCKGMIKTRKLPIYLHNVLDEIDIVRISGGEPSLLPNLNNYIKFFKDRDIKIILQSNGIILDILNKDIDEFWISLYGSEDIHDFITQGDNYYKTIGTIEYLNDNTNNVIIQSPIFNDYQLWSVIQEAQQLDVKLRLFALLKQGRCQFTFDINEQKKIYQNYKSLYNNIELTCSLDDIKCNYENKLVLKPDGSLFNCASHKHGATLCKK